MKRLAGFVLILIASCLLCWTGRAADTGVVNKKLGLTFYKKPPPPATDAQLEGPLNKLNEVCMKAEPKRLPGGYDRRIACGCFNRVVRSHRDIQDVQDAIMLLQKPAEVETVYSGTVTELAEEAKSCHLPVSDPAIGEKEVMVKPPKTDGSAGKRGTGKP